MDALTAELRRMLDGRWADVRDGARAVAEDPRFAVSVGANRNPCSRVSPTMPTIVRGLRSRASVRYPPPMTSA